MSRIQTEVVAPKSEPVRMSALHCTSNNCRKIKKSTSSMNINKLAEIDKISAFLIRLISLNLRKNVIVIRIYFDITHLPFFSLNTLDKTGLDQFHDGRGFQTRYQLIWIRFWCIHKANLGKFLSFC